MSDIKTLNSLAERITDPFIPPARDDVGTADFHQRAIAIIEALETHFLTLLKDDDNLLVDILNALTVGKVHIHHYQSKVYNTQLEMDRTDFYNHGTIAEDKRKAKDRLTN